MARKIRGIIGVDRVRSPCLLGLGLAGGGFVLGQRHIAGLAVWLVLVALLALGAAGRARLGRPFYWATG